MSQAKWGTKPLILLAKSCPIDQWIGLREDLQETVSTPKSSKCPTNSGPLKRGFFYANANPKKLWKGQQQTISRFCSETIYRFGQMFFNYWMTSLKPIICESRYVSEPPKDADAIAQIPPRMGLAARPLCMVFDALVIHGAPGNEKETAATKCLRKLGVLVSLGCCDSDAAILLGQYWPAIFQIASNILPEYHN